MVTLFRFIWYTCTFYKTNFFLDQIILLNISHVSSDKVGLLYFPLSSRFKKKKFAKNKASQNKCVYSALDWKISYAITLLKKLFLFSDFPQWLLYFQKLHLTKLILNPIYTALFFIYMYLSIHLASQKK